jgi:hypothetical protein
VGSAGSFLRFAVFATIMVAVLVFVVVPIAAGSLLGSLARDAGIGGDTVKVSVNLLGPGILSGRAESVNIQGDNVNVPHGVVGHLDLTLGDVSLSDHTFSTVSGQLTDVRLSGLGGSVVVSSVEVDGPSNRTRANGTVTASEARKLVKQVATTTGVAVDSVQLNDGSLTLVTNGHRTDATLRIAGTALVLDRPGEQSTVLFAPATSEDWQLQSVSVATDGIQLGLSVNAAKLAALMGPGLGSPH